MSVSVLRRSSEKVKVKVKHIEPLESQMRIVSVLLRLGSLVLIMAWVIYRWLHAGLDWFWLRLVLLWRWTRRKVSPLVGYALLSIRWRRDRSSQGEPGRNDEDKLTERSFSEQVEEEEEVQEVVEVEKKEEEAHWEGQHTGKKFGEEEEEEEECRVETTDELFCSYDSTWETEEQQEDTVRRTRRPGAAGHYNFSRFENAARDMHNYRHDYQFQTRPHHWEPVSRHKTNLMFYLGEIPSEPDGVYIHNFHNEWYGQYDRLEFVHSYIQWLFPLQEPGMNAQASTLTKEEIKEFLQNSIAKANLLKSYKLMLDFYGIMLSDEKTGQVTRALNWRDRFNNLNRNTHNNLRITRILKCLGTLGFTHYQAPLVHFFLKETLVHRELPKVKDSVLNYFVFAVRDKRQRRSLIKFAYLNYDRKEEFVWCPKKIQMMWLRQQQEMKGKKDACDRQQSPQNVYNEDEDVDEAI